MTQSRLAWSRLREKPSLCSTLRAATKRRWAPISSAIMLAKSSKAGRISGLLGLAGCGSMAQRVPKKLPSSSTMGTEI